MINIKAQKKYLHRLLSTFIVLSFLAITGNVLARGVYQTNNDFLKEVFDGQIPSSHVVWMKGDVRDQVEDILGHPYTGLRVRYWGGEDRNAWILEEIGKEEPITFGIVVKQNKIEQIKVLAYRESRGWEVKYPAFTQQFHNAGLKDKKLDTHIDGITGATLSVWAMTDVARMALYLHEFTNRQN